MPDRFKNTSINSRLIEFNEIAVNTLASFKHERMLLGFDQFNFSVHTNPSKYHDAVHFHGGVYVDMAKEMLLYLGAKQ